LHSNRTSPITQTSAHYAADSRRLARIPTRFVTNANLVDLGACRGVNITKARSH
jgi:hypothetical protein